MAIPVVDVTETMTFEMSTWRWWSETARKDACRKPPEPVRVEIHGSPVVNGFSPVGEPLEKIAEAVENAAYKALTRNGGPRREYLRAVHWTGGYSHRPFRGGWIPVWKDSTWKLFDRQEDGPLATFWVRFIPQP